jgi:hypothetical protein
MPRFNLNDDEMWLVPKLRALSATQQEVIYMLVRQMSNHGNTPLVVLPGNIVPLELQQITRRSSRKSQK